jgi:hypothetical protein
MNDFSGEIQELEKLKNNYYTVNKKNSILTKNQKLDCALQIVNKFSIKELLDKSIIIKKNSNQVHVSYPLVKFFLHPNNYNELNTKIIDISTQVVSTHGKYELHCDLKGFTPTAAQRYNELITYLCTTYLSDSADKNSLEKVYLYNTPVIFDAIKKMFSHFISQASRDKFIIVR